MAGAQVTLLSRIAAFESFGIPQFSGGGITIYPPGFTCTSYMQHPYGQGDITWQGAEFGLSAPAGANVTRIAVTITYRVSSLAAFSAVTAQLYANSSTVGTPASFPLSITSTTGTVTWTGGIPPANLATLAVQVTFHQVQQGMAYVTSAYATADYSFASSVGIITVAGESAVPGLVPHVSPPATAMLVAQGTVVETFTPAFGQPTKGGDLLLAWTLTNSASATFDTTCNDPHWTLIGYAGASFTWRALWYKAECGPGETAPVFSSGGSFEESQLLEFSGVTTLDQSGTVFSSGSADFTVSAGAQDTTSGDFIAAIMVWAADTPAVVTVSGIDSSGAPLALTTYSSAATSGQPVYAFSWAQAALPIGPGVDQVTASLSEFGESGAVLASFHAAASASFLPVAAIWRNPVNRAITIPIRAGR